jgi:radical SAM protein with 4Fe4S-binding SPASM domain
MFCGSLRKSSLKDVWSNSESLRSLRQLTLADLQAPCSSCRMATVCGGGSRSRALAQSLDVRAADLSCPLVRRAKAAA